MSNKRKAGVITTTSKASSALANKKRNDENGVADQVGA
jgi:hypothetical protein